MGNAVTSVLWDRYVDLAHAQMGLVLPIVTGNTFRAFPKTPQTADSVGKNVMWVKYANQVHAQRARGLHIVTINPLILPTTPQTAGSAALPVHQVYPAVMAIALPRSVEASLQA